jgi:glycosyltransferase
MVSIIIVTYNAEKTLDKAIQSILNQTYKNIECLIIDGNSMDSTVDVIKKYNVNYISEPDKGIYDAMNKGWKLAKGDWILYLGADDELCFDGVEALVNICSNADIVYGDTILKFFSGNTKRKGLQQLSVIKYRLFSCHQSFMMKRNIFKELNGFDASYKILGDFDLIQRAYLKGYRFKETEKIISIFSVGGISTDNIRAEKERYKILKKNKTIKFPLLLCLFFSCKKLLTKIKHFIS